jgi:hypothetical protein
MLTQLAILIHAVITFSGLYLVWRSLEISRRERNADFAADQEALEKERVERTENTARIDQAMAELRNLAGGASVVADAKLLEGLKTLGIHSAKCHRCHALMLERDADPPLLCAKCGGAPV